MHRIIKDEAHGAHQGAPAAPVGPRLFVKPPPPSSPHNSTLHPMWNVRGEPLLCLLQQTVRRPPKTRPPRFFL